MLELAVIVPSFNERANVDALVDAVTHALAGIGHEIIFVDDDSDDGTAAYVRQLSRANPHLRVIQRINRRGLSGAVAEGMLATSAPYFAVIDGDLQHDESLLPRMLDALRSTNADLVVGTRNAEGGSMGSFPTHRVWLSRLGQWLSKIVCKTQLSDPMSGFFMIRRSFFEEIVHSLSLTGFKILVDMMASAGRPVRVAEIPYQFRSRNAGASKLDTLVSLEYLLLLIDKLSNGWASARYVTFGMIGSLGVVLNALILKSLMMSGLSFQMSQTAAGCLVITLNFVLNNAFTFRAHRLRDGQRFFRFCIFFAACAVGLAMNVKLAALLNGANISPFVSGATGVLAGSVWNYWVTSVFVWRIGRTQRLKAVPKGSSPAQAPGIQ